MIITANGRAMGGTLIRGFEGFRPAPYQDIAGVWTIGYGDTELLDGAPVATATPAISEATAVQLSDRTIATRFIPELERMVAVDINDHQAAALLSFAYNEGVRALRSSTLLRHLNARRSEAAADQFLVWVYAKVDGRLRRIPDLERRRAIERSVFLGVAPPASPAPPAPSSAEALNDQELEQLQS